MQKSGVNIVEGPKAALIDNLEDINDDVYTLDTGRSVRRRRSPGSMEDSPIIKHGIVSLGQLNKKALEVHELADKVMLKMMSVITSLSKKSELEAMAEEFLFSMEKLERNLKQLEEDVAKDQEADKFMKIIEGGHEQNLHSEYMR